MNNFKLFKLSLCLIFINTLQAQTAKVSGTLKQWHKISISVTIPGAALSESATTFKDHRMDVIFTSPNGKKIRVPGFFAADNKAANSSAKSGNTYKAYLRPNVTGTWKYEALFYKKTNVALNAVSQLGTPTYRVSGTVGSIAASDKRSPDLRSKGRLSYQAKGTNTQKRYLRFEGNKEYFLKLGPDSPENLLNYTAFDRDAVRANCSVCKPHTYSPHGQNYQSGDITWKGGKGKNLVGALNYLSDQKMNAISMSLFGGDDINVFPWSKLSDKYTFDVSKLEQWELVFDHAEKKGLLLHFKLAENENWDALNSNQLKIYYREMVARFGHHLAIEWNISEEYRGSAASAMERINWLAAIDPWQSHRVIHTYPGEHKKYQEWLSLKAKLTGASIQTSNANNYSGAFSGRDGILTWVNNSQEASSPWVVTSDEQNSGVQGVFTSASISNSTVVPEARTKVLWKTLIAGGAGVMWYGGSQGDFKTENFNRFSTLFKWSRYAIVDFFKKNNIAFWNAKNVDELVSNKTAHCLAEAGKTYIVYLEKGGTTTLNLSKHSKNFKIQWFNPRTGGNLQSGSKTMVKGGSTVAIGNPPSGSGDWVALLTDVSEMPKPPTGVCKADFVEENNRVIIEAESLNLAGTSWKKKAPKNGSTGSGYIAWEGSVNYGRPSSQKLTATIEIKNPGRYRFQWRNNYGKGSNTTEHNDSWLRFPDASSFYAVKGTSKVYPIGSGKTPNAKKGGGYDGWFKVWLTGNGKWSWYSKTWDSNSHDIYVEFDKPGVYTMEISGRSQHHLIDRIILFKDKVNAQDLSLKESICATRSNGNPLVNIPPTLSIKLANNKTQYKVGETASITIPASDPDGRISKVAIFVNNVLLKSDTTSPYSTNYRFATEGTFTIKAIAFDNKGRTTTRFAKVKATKPTKPVPNKKPSVSLSKINSTTTYAVGQRISIGANASDSDGSISKVVFYAKGVTILSTDTKAPYEAIFTPAFTGNYAITARAYDNKGAVTISKNIFVKVGKSKAPPTPPTNVNKAPKVFLTKIGNGWQYELGKNINIGANATDEDGRIVKVEFFAKGVISLGTEYNAPYTASFKPAFAGKYVITARATDNKGSTTTSPSFTIHVVKTTRTTTTTQPSDPTVRTTPKTETLSTIHDAYLDNGNRLNINELRVEKGRRISYLMFDLSKIKGAITSANLNLIVGSDGGHGTFEVYRGSHELWSENTISNNSKPSVGDKVGTISDTYASGSAVSIPLSVEDLNAKKLTLIIKQINGNDVSFASKEHTSLKAPELVVTYNAKADKSAEFEAVDFTTYPNPATTALSVKMRQFDDAVINLYSMTGELVKSEIANSEITTMDISELASGVYMIRTLLKDQIVSKRIVVK